MLIAIPVTGDNISGPGEASEILILDSDDGYSVKERYENPALTASSARGISMIQSAAARNASVMVVAHIGAHAFGFIQGRMKIYSGLGMNVQEAVSRLKKGELTELTEEMPGHGHYH